MHCISDQQRLETSTSRLAIDVGIDDRSWSVSLIGVVVIQEVVHSIERFEIAHMRHDRDISRIYYMLIINIWVSKNVQNLTVGIYIALTGQYHAQKPSSMSLLFSSAWRRSL